MVDTPVFAATIDLLWSLWSELGVTGVARHHRHCALDPEPLILFTSALAAQDPRLEGLARVWCARHGERISKSRLQGMRRRAPKAVQIAFSHFEELLGNFGEPWSPRRKQRTPNGTRPPPIEPPPLERPALVHLRMRALAGVGARGDVLCTLLARAKESTWVSASDLEFLGYSKRRPARILTELAEAGIAVSRNRRNTLLFRLTEPDLLAGLVAARDLRWPNWLAIFNLAWGLNELELHAEKSRDVRRVRARASSEEFRNLAFATGSPPPPATVDNVSAYEDMIQWGKTALGSIADD